MSIALYVWKTATPEQPWFCILNSYFLILFSQSDFLILFPKGYNTQACTNTHVFE